MPTIPIKRGSWITMAAMLSAVLMISCGGGTDTGEGITEAPQGTKEARHVESVNLGVSIVSVDKEISPQVAENIVAALKTYSPEFIVDATFYQVASDELSAKRSEIQNEADLIYFPSTAFAQMKVNQEDFYPASLTEITLPHLLDAAFSAESPDAHWAVPLALDPVVMVTKRTFIEVIGLGAPPSSWSEIFTINELLKRDELQTFPQLAYLSGTPQQLTDGFVGHVISRGYGRHHLDPEAIGLPEWYDDEVEGFSRVIQTLRDAFTGSQTDTIIEIPQVSDLKSFMNSPASYTFCRLSTVNAMNAQQREQVMVGPIPSTDLDVALCHAYAVAVPMSARKPQAAHRFIRTLLQSAEKIAHTQGILPINQGSAPGLDRPYSENTVFLPRINQQSLNEKVILDLYNGKINVEETKRHWQGAYFFPEKQVILHSQDENLSEE